jgi:hypothetical protein
MKKVRIPFDLTEYKKGGYKVYDNKGEVSIIKTDVKINNDICKKYPIVGISICDEVPYANFYTEDGTCLVGVKYNKLVLVKQEFEDGDILADDKDIKPKCTLQPFDKVLVRDFNIDEWFATSFSNATINGKYRICSNCYYDQCIPYNDETKHLIGTTDDAPEKYKTW